jgi:plastocyanin
VTLSKGAGLLLVGGLAVTGCASSSGASSGSGTAVEAKEFQFIPSSLTAPANGSITVTVTNNGTKQHNFSIKELNVNQDVDVGKSATVTINTKNNASLTFFCEYHGTSNGMKGTLTVGSGGAAGSSGSSPATNTTSPRGYGY